MRIAIAAGGTGGHIYPAISVVEALRKREPAIEVRVFGPDNRGERTMVEGAGLVLERIPAAAMRDRGPLAVFRGGLRIVRGIALSWWKLRRFKADAVFSTGGYGSFPQSVAARLLRKPLVVFLPDVAPGWAVKAERRFATRMATSTDLALQHLPPGKTSVTGYPVRSAFFDTNRNEMRRALGAGDGDPILLIAGASQGAQALNRAVFAHLAELTKRAHVVHITGAAGAAEAGAAKRELGNLESRYQPFSFRGDLPALMVAADLAILRAGASILGEVPAAGLAAILLPGEYAGGHQRGNALWLVEAGAAELLTEAEIGILAPSALSILDDPERLQRMRAAATLLARPQAADTIATIIEEVVKR
ncbi:MAG: UDP-N-acetylglucosamine--N-acetylmuramyl-(pentapeptide) pyrophosphoryl-undecaprenol N-acetylglucosamine transferase [Dehalococcoidia bacterium]|nr:UDP-N-acetylglucosamine--N-acetylmuramyl-(pentapeptide) pyrophosphoryl-undecaprenol N-acetylglucosamine transferase [Dehalococcoidia bacterium]MCB9485435.1 UDP-N-acetylglucosamine--N-acetylmuramyl-(pentapeptide) pyrophosphoryl-undecaprenol N-acetylglucosamine transferase [Thermoflexaceae bacterium]